MKTVKMTVNRPALADFRKGWLEKADLPGRWFLLTLGHEQYEAWPGCAHFHFDAAAGGAE